MSTKIRVTSGMVPVAVCVLLFQVTTLASQALPRVGVTSLLNTSDDPGSEVLADTISRAIALNLDLLGGYDVQSFPDSLRSTAPADLDAFAARNRRDNLVFGFIEKPDARTTVFRVALYDRGSGAITYENEWTISSVLEVFDTADLVVEAMLSQFSDERISFGELVISNDGTRGTYRVYVDDNYLGEDVTQTRILAGTYQIRVEQTRMFGTHTVREATILVPEDGIGRLPITIPGLTSEESERLVRFRSRLDTSPAASRQTVDFQSVVNEYITLARDMEEANYSRAINEQKEEIDQAFNAFVAWYSQSPAPETIPEAEVGTIQATTRSAGTVYLDDVVIKQVRAGDSFLLENVPPGSRQVHVRYPDGEEEIRIVTVTGGTRATASFNYELRPEPQYRVGGRGPAGGIIIHDKRGTAGGWRYVEVSPRDIANDRVSWTDAFDLARRYRQGGYSDWRLPSRSELQWMYAQRNRIPNIASARYWSMEENNRFTAWNLNFLTGQESSALKGLLSGRARVVRTF
ncbi:MAG: DUF1566 domain-containing protein [Spirochaetaceae bacterium]|nr:MAG: DUF1566 domain-containing protein [Spirochaetaceae bacterium]